MGIRITHTWKLSGKVICPHPHCSPATQHARSVYRRCINSVPLCGLTDCHLCICDKFEVYYLLRDMKVSALAVLAAFAVPTGAEIYLKEQFNDKVRDRILCPLVVKVTLAG
jgi:hypothetical protein